jgi:hypothetical protein
MVPRSDHQNGTAHSSSTLAKTVKMPTSASGYLSLQSDHDASSDSMPFSYSAAMQLGLSSIQGDDISWV